MDNKPEGASAVKVAPENKKKTAYQKPKLERFGSVVDFTGGLSLPALESGDEQNRHF